MGKEKEEKLFFREWVAAIGICLVVFALFGISLLDSRAVKQARGAYGASSKVITVQVTGAVESPGVYEVDLGTSLEIVLQRAKCKASADKRSIYMKKTLLGSCSVHVPEKKERKSKKKKGDFDSIISKSLFK